MGEYDFTATQHSMFDSIMRYKHYDKAATCTQSATETKPHLDFSTKVSVPTSVDKTTLSCFYAVVGKHGS